MQRLHRTPSCRRLLAAALATAGGLALPALGASTVAAAAAAAPTSVGTRTASFYDQPAHLGSRANGAIIRSRPTTVKLAGAVPVPAVKAWQVMYKSRDAHRRPVADVTTVIVPTAPWIGTGPRPVVSQQFAEDSLGGRCAPSYSLHTGSNSIVTAETSNVVAMLAQGYAVVAPDHEGLHSQFAVGRQAGRAVLDGVKAALHFKAAKIAGRAQVFLNGYSGGAIATAWATELQKSYAPGLRRNIVGAATGGTPADLKANALFLDGTSNAGLEFLAVLGVYRAYPDVRLDSLLNSAGRRALGSLKHACVQDAVLPFAFKKLDDYTKRPNAIQLPRFEPVFAATRLGGRKPIVPVYSYHAINDEIVPIGPDDKLVASYCRRGVVVDRVRDPLSDHLSLEASQSGAVMAYIRERFAGTTPANTCG